MAENKNTKKQIRNSTVDFLIFTKDAHEDGIEVRVQDHDVWLTQKAIGQLFEVDRSVVTFVGCHNCSWISSQFGKSNSVSAVGNKSVGYLY